MKVKVTYFCLDDDLLSLMHLHAKLHDPTLPCIFISNFITKNVVFIQKTYICISFQSINIFDYKTFRHDSYEIKNKLNLFTGLY